MSKKTKIFFDTEFTGLHQKTTLISIGLVSECGKMFYAELNDFDKTQIDDWLQKNVIDNLEMQTSRAGIARKYKHLNKTVFFGSMKGLKNALSDWLKQFDNVIMWSDCLAYDWVLFNEIFGHAFNIPKNVYYIPMDLCTLFEIKGIDPDISREEFAHIENMKLANGKYPETEKDIKKHNALFDALIIKQCYLNAIS